MRGMVVGEGGRSSGVLLYYNITITITSQYAFMQILLSEIQQKNERNIKISHAFSIKIEWSHSTKSLERIVGIHTIFKMKKQ